MPEAEARHEMAGSRDRLAAELQVPVRHLAYPFGGYSECGPREFRLAAALGFRTAVTTRRGNVYPEHRSHLTALPRTAVAVMPTGQSRRYVRASLYGARNAVLNRMRRVVTA
jgi:peptidoglycan/xylan/chitin deacetylase (PgdA/CDA1 family)